MVRVRRIAAIAILGVVAATYGAASPARAQVVKTENFKASALGVGLNLKLGNQSLTLGHAQSSIDGLFGGTTKTLNAVAEGAGQLLTNSVVSTKAPNGGVLTDSKPQACVANVPVVGAGTLHLLNISAACGVSSSSVKNDLPTTSAEGYVADIRVPAEGLLGQILGALNLDDLATQLNGLLGSGVGTSANETNNTLAVDNVLGGLLGSLGGAPVLNAAVPQVNNVLNNLLQLLDTNSLASLVPDPVVLQVGTSKSLLKTDLNTVTSTASGRGVEIKILPVSAIPTLANGIIHIVIGESDTVATYNRLTGKSTADVKAANLLKLEVLGVSVPVAPNLDLSILDGTPLASRIVLGKGTTNVLGDRAEATATGAFVSLLNGLIELDIAKAQSLVGGAFNETTSKVLGVEAVRQLPRTGGPGPLFPAVGATILVLAVVSRRMVLRTR